MTKLIQNVREMVSEQFEFRELLFQMVRRDLLIRYKQSVMGFGWAIFMPLVNTAIFSVIFIRVAPIRTSGFPIRSIAFCGLLAWNFFASSLPVLDGVAHVEPEPRDEGLFPAGDFSVLGRDRLTVDFAVGAVVLVGLMFYYKSR